MISAVIFDFDGTLVDSNGIKRQGFLDVVAGHRGGIERMERLLGRTHGSRREVFAAYAAEAEALAVPEYDIDHLVATYTRRVDSLVAAAPEMPGAGALLELLRRHRRRVYLSSATPLNSLQDVAQRRGWAGWFEGIFGYPASKRESLLQVQRAGVAVTAMAVVGDGADDRASAAAVGCAFFPVGEARGATGDERVFKLAELADVLLDQDACLLQ